MIKFLPGEVGRIMMGTSSYNLLIKTDSLETVPCFVRVRSSGCFPSGGCGFTVHWLFGKAEPLSLMYHPQTSRRLGLRPSRGSWGKLLVSAHNRHRDRLLISCRWCFTRRLCTTEQVQPNMHTSNQSISH